MTTFSGTPAVTARDMLAEARSFLVMSDLSGASGRAWDAAEQAVKQVAERRCWPYEDEGDFFKIVDRLAQECDDDLLTRSALTAYSQQQNAYEDWQTYPFVLGALDRIEEFVRRIEQLPD